MYPWDTTKSQLSLRRGLSSEDNCSVTFDLIVGSYSNLAIELYGLFARVGRCCFCLHQSIDKLFKFNK